MDDTPLAILARIFDAAAVPSVSIGGVLRRASSLASGIADRPKDRTDILGLMAIPNVDRTYVEHWATEGGVAERPQRARTACDPSRTTTHSSFRFAGGSVSPVTRARLPSRAGCPGRPPIPWFEMTPASARRWGSSPSTVLARDCPPQIDVVTTE